MLIGLAALAAVIFILNEIAATYYLYWLYWWYDVMMHFLGGVMIGGLAAWGALRFDIASRLSRLLLITLVAIIAVGTGWEIFEYLTGQYIGQHSIVFDTTVDFIMDTLGALLAALLVWKLSSSHIAASSVREAEPANEL